MKKRSCYRRPKDYKNLGKAEKRRLLYTHRIPQNRFEYWILKSVESPFSDKIYMIPFAPPMMLFFTWGAWGDVVFWVGCSAAIISFGFFVRMAESMSEKVVFEREEPVKSIYSVWWESFRVVFYINGVAIFTTSLVHLFF
ncbi:MAG: hypothetical protein ACQEUY_09585 [Pseudomonadota bacterium]